MFLKENPDRKKNNKKVANICGSIIYRDSLFITHILYILQMEKLTYDTENWVQETQQKESYLKKVLRI